MKIILTERQLNYLVLMEASKHTENLYKSWAKKKSGNEEAALSIMDDVLSEKLPKDFSKYSSYEELKSDLDKIQNKKKEKETESDVVKLYKVSGDSLEVVHPNTWQASCDYGSTSKWCTTSRKSPSDWQHYNTTGTEFFWIFKDEPKSSPEHKYSYHIHFGGGVDWCNAINDPCVPELSKNSKPKQHPKYDEIINKLNKFHNKRMTEFLPIQKSNESYLLNKLNLIDIQDFFNFDKLIIRIGNDFKIKRLDDIINEYKLDTELDSEEFDEDTIIDDVNQSLITYLDLNPELYENDLIPKIQDFLIKKGIPPSKKYSEINVDIEEIIRDINQNNPKILEEIFSELVTIQWEEQFKELYPELGIYI
jgi:hypothetical protein